MTVKPATMQDSQPQATVSIIIPSYNEPELLDQCLASILPQLGESFEVIISDDASDKDFTQLVRKYLDPRIRWFFHETQLGYGPNLNRAFRYSIGDIIILLGHDDIFLPNAITATIAPFSDPSVQAVTRPYYWFFDDVTIPNRAVYPLEWGTDRTVTTNSPRKHLRATYWSIAQLSGLAYRRHCLQEMPFNDEIFTAHVWPFLFAMTSGSVVYLGDFTVAVRTGSSMTRHISKVYDSSPTQAWIDSFERIFSSEHFAHARAAGFYFLATWGRLGLVQIRTYGSREAFHHERSVFRTLGWQQLTYPQYLLLEAVISNTPPRMLRLVADYIRKGVLGRIIPRRTGNMTKRIRLRYR